MSVGIVTFHKHTQLGFYRYGHDDYCEPLEMDALLSSLHVWFQDRVSLEDTLLWDDETPGYSHRKKVYLKSIEKDEETGEYILVLWRAVGSGDGVYGIKADARLDDNTLYDANNAADGARVIWGEASYYWFIPSKNLFASIRFSNSIADTNLMNLFFRDFVWLHADIREKRREVREGKTGAYTTVSFPAQQAGETGNLWFRISSKQYTKLTTRADLGAIARDITHFVKREVIAAREVDQADWTRFFGRLPFVSAEITKDTRKVEINIEAKPTAEELQQIFEQYAEDYNGGLDGWRNLGFRKEGVGGICWLNSFVVKNVLPIDDTTSGGVDDTGHYTAQRLFTALQFKRDGLLAPFGVGVAEAAAPQAVRELP
ncbi:hypothetical protein EIZ89_19360 [Escherichia coli]|uniref:hypothetical protein n=1 Tax=Escherichia coli TaxID=562 RepID=UPI00128FA64E|nr:hypothetical protein [Escherichia coli]MCA7567229.1 hypothetical protein [Escherichia coli]MCH7023653.1 hypothetical protein [Escherichia coli]MQJ69302.1 hypothetical protein [Escherichia coli]HBD1437021.1 hypothetical protein [Escherichia coli]HBN0857333.1 hypothetical protein [Escherichia coli]